MKKKETRNKVTRFDGMDTEKREDKFEEEYRMPYAVSTKT